MAKLCAATAAYSLVVFGAFPRFALPSGVVAVTLLTTGIGWFIMLLRSLKRPAHRTLDEMMHGYSTLSSNMPNYSSRSEHRWSEGGPPWDYSGVWLLDRNFTVQSPPNRQFDPPGFYPSPHQVEQWELWTGVVWSGMYRNSPWTRTSASSL